MPCVYPFLHHDQMLLIAHFIIDVLLLNSILLSLWLLSYYLRSVLPHTLPLQVPLLNNYALGLGTEHSWGENFWEPMLCLFLFCFRHVITSSTVMFNAICTLLQWTILVWWNYYGSKYVIFNWSSIWMLENFIWLMKTALLFIHVTSFKGLVFQGMTLFVRSPLQLKIPKNLNFCDDSLTWLR